MTKWTHRPTRYKELGYHNPMPRHWRFIDTDSGCEVGPVYKSKDELLADLDRYAVAGGWVSRI